MPLAFQWQSLAAFVGGAIVGQIITIIQLQHRSGGVRSGVARAYRVKWRDAMKLFVVDGLGGLLLVLIVVLAGATEPSQIVALVDGSPLAGWALVGAPAFLFSDHLFGPAYLGRLANLLPDGLSSQEGPSVSDLHLRAEAVRKLEREAWKVVRADLVKKKGHLLDECLIALRDAARFETFVLDAVDYIDRFPESDSSRVVSDAISAFRAATTDSVRANEAVRIARALIDTDNWEPVERLVDSDG